MVDAFVGVSQARGAALLAAGQPVPNLVPIRALIDTGASTTCVDPSVLTALALTPTGTVSMTTSSTGASPHTVDQFDVSLFVPPASASHPPLVFQTVAVASVELLATQGFHALIGRDILRNCILGYNGAINLFTIAY